jgi:hypothetical protein
MTILEWLINVVVDEDRRAALHADPQALIQTDPDLTDAQRKVLLSHDAERIRHVIEYEQNIDPAADAMHLIFSIQMHNHFEQSS